MRTDYAGIDYSMGRSNVDRETGIHYGVISVREVMQAWHDDSEAYYIDACPYCGEELTIQKEDLEYPLDCDTCHHTIEEDDFDMQEPVSFFYKDDGYEAEQTADDTDIFILKSPYYTWCQYCSPCAPGAGYLTSWTEKDVGIKAYCFASDWFEDGKAPYPVYRVQDDSLVE